MITEEILLNNGFTRGIYSYDEYGHTMSYLKYSYGPLVFVTLTDYYVHIFEYLDDNTETCGRDTISVFADISFLKNTISEIYKDKLKSIDKQISKLEANKKSYSKYV